jgi:hypothetical protein
MAMALSLLIGTKISPAAGLVNIAAGPPSYAVKYLFCERGFLW